MIEIQDIVQLAGIVLSLAGFGSLIGLIVNVGKTAGVVKDGTAQNWAMGLNLLLMIAMYLGGFLGFDLAAFDGVAGQIANVGIAILQLMAMIGGARGFHGAAKGVPVIGRSYSNV